jgi:hypothetical protein
MSRSGAYLVRFAPPTKEPLWQRLEVAAQNLRLFLRRAALFSRFFRAELSPLLHGHLAGVACFTGRLMGA